MEDPKIVNQLLLWLFVAFGVFSIIASLHTGSFLPVLMWLLIPAVLLLFAIVNTAVFGPLLFLLGKMFPDGRESEESDVERDEDF
jgi:hypothetical protein